jgi:thioredoxin reductase (NADPH)
MTSDTTSTEAAIIGAGPIGLEVACELRRAGIPYLHFDKGQIASTIAWFPQGMTFFSSNDRIAIAGLPIQTLHQAKCSKEEYLAYLRSVALAFDLKVRTYEEVTAIDAQPGGGFVLTSRNSAGIQRHSVRRVVLAIGDMAGPRLLGIAGEELAHVSHYFEEPHRYFRQKLLIVGGKNSAAEAALRCYHAGAEVTLSYRGAEFPPNSVKYWLLPELSGRIQRGEIGCYFRTAAAAISPTHVTLARCGGGGSLKVEADFVLLLVGYLADSRLFRMVGVKLSGETGAPVFDEQTMETNVPGLYVAGTATAGTQQSYRIFIENCHIHALRIAAALRGAPPPPAPPAITAPES